MDREKVDIMYVVSVTDEIHHWKIPLFIWDENCHVAFDEWNSSRSNPDAPAKRGGKC